MGTVTFLRSDIEGSMELVRALGRRYDDLNREHGELVRAAVATHGGHLVRTEGDAFFVVFAVAGAAARAAVEIQRSMTRHDWPEGYPARVRIGLHTGEATRAGDDYGGFEVNRAARIAEVGWGGQIILSDQTRSLIAGDLPGDCYIRDLGRHRLKGLAEPERIYQLAVAGLRADFPPLRSVFPAAHGLPLRTTPLIGREAELETLDRLLAETRLLTLTGVGGTGKTTLALELARRHAGEFRDGAYLIDLQAVRDDGQVRAEIARGIGLLDGPAGTAADRLESYLGEREVLLVIDNFEQVIRAAMMVDGVLAASPLSRIIVTSRVALKLRAEQEFAVRPMRVDTVPGDSGSDAVRLFAERARRIRPELPIADAQSATIAEICRLVDGLPLAIELCAARVASLSLPTIRERLQNHQPLPGSGPRDLPERQRTVEQTVAWSYDLLEPPLQRLFSRLAVFEESFDQAQAESVCGASADLGVDVLDGLALLAENSLLTRPDDAVGGVRFGWLETIRAFALERLAVSGESDVMRAKRTRAFAELAWEAGRHLPGAGQAYWFDRLAADDANLRAAMRHALEVEDADSALRLVGGLWRYWLQSGRMSEARTSVASALEMPDADALTALRIRALDAAGGLEYWSGNPPAAQALYEQELALAQSIGDRPGEALAWLDLFFTRDLVGDVEGALAAKATAESIMHELGDSFGLARMQQFGFMVLLARGMDDPVGALADVEASAARAEALDDPWLRRSAPALRAFVHLTRGETGAMLAELAQALRANLLLRERADAVLVTHIAVIATSAIDRPEVTAVLHGTAEAALEQLGIRAPVSYAELLGLDPIAHIREQLGSAAFEAAVDEGRRLSLEEAVDFIEEVATSMAR